MLTLGIDDSGRGPAIGPMVLAGVLANEDIKKEFVKIGVKDSKELSPRKREILAQEILKKAIAMHKVIILPYEIDGKNGDKLNLNQREAVAMAVIINKLNKRKEEIEVVIDCPSVNISAWKKYLEQFLIGAGNLKILCEHKADKNHVAVSAASIIAKTTRDAEIKKIKKAIGMDFGSGYSSDPITRRFISEYYDEFKDMGIFRESWGTIKEHKLKKVQKKLEV